MKTSESHKDQGLRLAVKRKNETAERMTLSDDFADRLMQRIGQQSQGAQQKPKRRLVWLYTAIGAVAASMLLLLTLRHQSVEEPKGPLSAKVEQVEDVPVVAKVEQQEETTQQTSVPVVEPIRHQVTNEHLQTAKHNTEVQNTDDVLDTDPNLHYASLNTSNDTVPYQDPARVDEFIVQLAEYHKVKEGGLTCSAVSDSSMVSAVYVFPDKDEVNLFSRLLQVACWYSDKTPGYHLNFSQQQFFFELKDMRRQLQYRWIAERINGRILFYGTHTPLGTKESSACYQQYRDELMYQNSFNSKTKKL